MNTRGNLGVASPAMGRPRATDQRSIVAAVLAEGLADFTVTSVARRLNINHATIYHYYHSREEMVVAAVNTVVAEIEWDATGQPWRAMLDTFARTLWELCQRAPGFAGCVLNMSHTPDGIARIINRFVARLENYGMNRGQAHVLIDLIGEEVLLTSMLLTKAGDTGVELPPIADTHNLDPSADDELIWAAHAGWLAKKLKLIFDGAAYQLGV